MLSDEKISALQDLTSAARRVKNHTSRLAAFRAEVVKLEKELVEAQAQYDKLRAELGIND